MTTIQVKIVKAESDKQANFYNKRIDVIQGKKPPCITKGYDVRTLDDEFISWYPTKKIAADSAVKLGFTPDK